MRFLFKDPFASQFRFFSQVFTSARGIVSIWGEGRVVGLCNGGGGMDLLKMTSQQLPPLFQRIRLVLLSVGWQWNVNRWHWTNLKTPCETLSICPMLWYNLSGVIMQLALKFTLLPRFRHYNWTKFLEFPWNFREISPFDKRKKGVRDITESYHYSSNFKSTMCHLYNASHSSLPCDMQILVY